MQEKKTLFVGQIVAQYTLIGHFDLVFTTSRLRALQNLPSAEPSLRRKCRTRHCARGYGKDEKTKCFEGFSVWASSVQELCLIFCWWHSWENNEAEKEALSLALGIYVFH